MAMKSGVLLILLALAGCANLPPPPPRERPACEVFGEASYDCQVERYRNISTP